MSKHEALVVVSDLKDLDGYEGRLVTADAFLEGERPETRVRGMVINLCRSWRYLSKGYYVSLLADARGQRVVPTQATIEGILNPRVVFRALQEQGIDTVDSGQMAGRARALPAAISPQDEPGNPSEPTSRKQAALVRHMTNGVLTYRPAEHAETADVVVALGRCEDRQFKHLAASIYRVWPMPVFQARLLREDDVWKVIQLVPLKVHKLGEPERKLLIDALREPRPSLVPQEVEDNRASLALLYDENDPHRPSSPETIDKFERIASREGLHVARIFPHEIDRLSDYDALFIRIVTGPEKPAFRFALHAEALGMPVIDDTVSILRCSNKVYLHELLSREGVPTPKTMIVTRRTSYSEAVDELGLPFVLKLPDGTFSNAVFKVKNEDDYDQRTGELFRRSPLVLGQAFTPTDFDWRVTTLAGKPLFAARYHMAKGHWQIVTNVPGQGRVFGRVEAVPLEKAPREVLRIATRATKLIGDGLYGVDLKELDDGPVVIEINDNPNLDVGYEDAVEGESIYKELVSWFLRRIEEGYRPKAEPVRPRRGDDDPFLKELRRPIGRRTAERTRAYRAYEVCGLELEYPVVDRDLNVVSLVEPALRELAGQPASDATLGVVGYSNEIADHVMEIKTEVPLASLAKTEALLVEGVQRMGALLANRFEARLLPTGMHPWFNPKKARLWTRSNRRTYQTYARLFDTTTHGWVNVQAMHVNLPLGRDDEAVAMMNAAALLVPYLPALAASSPMYDGELQPAVDNRLAFILGHQERLPESLQPFVPQFVTSLGQYRRDVLKPMYQAVDLLEDASALRHEFLNARSAVFKFSRASMEVRVLDTQECVKLDVAIAAFVRAALKSLSRDLLKLKLVLPAHDALVEDLMATIQRGTRARVHAPFIENGLDRDDEGRASIQDVLAHLIDRARKAARTDEEDYLDLVEGISKRGNLSECVARALQPYIQDDIGFTEAARKVYIELCDCLMDNQPWRGRLL